MPRKPGLLGGSTSGRCEEYRRLSRRTKILLVVLAVSLGLANFTAIYERRRGEYLERILRGAEEPPEGQLGATLESIAAGLGTAGGIVVGAYIGKWLGYRACLLREKIKKKLKEKLAARKRR